MVLAVRPLSFFLQKFECFGHSRVGGPSLFSFSRSSPEKALGVFPLIERRHFPCCVLMLPRASRFMVLSPQAALQPFSMAPVDFFQFGVSFFSGFLRPSIFPPW